MCSCVPAPSRRTWTIGWRWRASSCMRSAACSAPANWNISALLTAFTVNSNFLVGKAACLNDPAFSSLGTTWCRNARRRKKAEWTGKAYEYAEFWHRKSSSFKQNISPLFNNVWTSTALFLTSWWFLLFSLCWGAGPQSRQQCLARATPYFHWPTTRCWKWKLETLGFGRNTPSTTIQMSSKVPSL